MNLPSLSMLMNLPSISLLVPTYNRADVIARIQDSWMELRGLSQLVLVDDGSTQDYGPLVASLKEAGKAKGVEVVYLKSATREGSPAAKNKGLAYCTGNFILTTDDDITLDPDMAINLLAAGKHKGPKAVMGARVVYRKDGESEEEALRRAQLDHSTYFNARGLTVVPWSEQVEPVRTPFVTAVALWPADLFKQGLRYFTEYGGNGYREETDPQLTAQSTYGASVWYCANAICYHLPPSQAYGQKSGQRRGGWLWYEYWVMKNNVTFLRRHGKWLKNDWNISPTMAFMGLAWDRFGGPRWKALFRKLGLK